MMSIFDGVHGTGWEGTEGDSFWSKQERLIQIERSYSLSVRREGDICDMRPRGSSDVTVGASTS